MTVRNSLKLHRLRSLLAQSDAAMMLDGLRHAVLGFVPTRRESLRLESKAVAMRRLAYTPLRSIARSIWSSSVDGGNGQRFRELKVGWSRWPSLVDLNHGASVRLADSIVLRAPSASDKGVLYCSFEYNWLKLVASGKLESVKRDYYLVGASSWSPTDYACFANLAGLGEDPTFVGISNTSDVEAYRIAAPHIEPLDQLASDWVNPDEFTVVPRADRDIDVIMVAHFARWKRHWMLFEALREMSPDLNVVIIGRDTDGRTAHSVLDEARAFGVRQQVTVFTNLHFADVRTLLSRAKSATILSQREGSCVSVAEALAADCPVVALDESHIGSLAYINRATGLRVPVAGLGAALTALIEGNDHIQPRAWYAANSGCWNASRDMERHLAKYAHSKGRVAGHDMAPLKWSYVPSYANAEDAARLSSARDHLAAVHGVELEDFVPPKQGIVRTDALHDFLDAVSL